MSNGVVTHHLAQLIARHVEDHGLVVWYDPSGEYRAAAESLAIPGASIARHDGSFFRLRHEIDPLLNDLNPPRLVVYVPLDQARTHHALIELEAAGVVVQPGQQPPVRNTRLSLVARNALRPLLGEARAADIEKQVEAGKLTLADLDRLGDQQGSGVLSLIFGTASPQDVALAFLSGPERDAEIAAKSAAGELRDLLRPAFEADLPDDAPLDDLRDRLARHVLMTDLLAGLGDSAPPSLATVKVAATTPCRDACLALARTWRLRRDLRDGYVAAASRVEQDFSLAQVDLDPASLAALETVPCVERTLLRHAQEALLARPTAEVLALARSRQSRFWAEAIPSLLARWTLVAAAAEVLLEADRVARAIKKAPKSVPDLVSAYAEGDAPWCLLDTHHRHMERRWYDLESSRGDDHGTLDTLIIRARQRYTEVGSDLARHFVTQFSKARHPIPGLRRQVQVFEAEVRPLLGRGKVAYVWVDALRFEMARELVEVLRPDFETTLRPAIGTLPTITEIGMAALLPRADQGFRVVPGGPGKLALEIGGIVVKDRKDRINFLKAHAGVSVFDAKLDDLLPRPSKRVRDGIGGNDLILITSQEIDELCEADNIAQARRQMDGVLKDLRRGLRVLSDLGVRTIVLAADHGHLFGEEVGEDMKIEAPGGEAADLHQRAWVGVGGTSESSYLRTSLASLGVPSDLDFATPLTLACFRAKGGNRAYFHGGLSPQEAIIPVMVLTPTASASDAPPTGIEWVLSTGSKKLSTRFFSVRVGGRSTGLFGLEPPTVRVEVRAKGKPISVPVSASYGFEEATGDVTLKPSEDDPKQIEPNTVTLMVTEEDIAQKTVGVSLLDAATGVELASLDKIEVAISM